MARRNARKEYPGGTERDAANFDFSQECADGDNYRQHKYRVGNALSKDKLFDKFHSCNCKCLGKGKKKRKTESGKRKTFCAFGNLLLYLWNIITRKV